MVLVIYVLCYSSKLTDCFANLLLLCFVCYRWTKELNNLNVYIIVVINCYTKLGESYKNTKKRRTDRDKIVVGCLFVLQSKILLVFIIIIFWLAQKEFKMVVGLLCVFCCCCCS